MNSQQPPTIRSDDLLRHLQDLQTGTYEGVQSRGAKEELYRKGIELLTPVATTMLEEANRLFLRGTGHIEVIGPNNEQPTVHTVRVNHSNQYASLLLISL